MRAPTVWGAGSIFAFSGLEGESTFKDSLVGTLCGDRIGVAFHLQYHLELRFDLSGVKDLEFQAVTSDLISATIVQTKTEAKIPLVITFLTQDIVIGCGASCAQPALNCEFANQMATFVQGNAIVNATGSEYTAFARYEDAERVRFAFACSKVSAADAAAKSQRGLDADLPMIVRQRMAFYEQLPVPAGLDEKVEATLAKCFSIMKSQVYSPEGRFPTRWTTPDRLPHQKLWLWDSVFHSLGNRYLSETLAYESIRAVLATQKADGFIGHMSDPVNQNSTIIQPPVLAWGIYNLFQFGNNVAILKETYPALQKYLLWNLQNRDVNRNHLYEWSVQTESVHCRCDESGMDNSPRFDNVTAMDCIDFSCFMANEARVMAKIAALLELEAGRQFWENTYGEIKAAVNQYLWDGRDGFYYDRILATHEFKKVKAISSFLPLFAGICDYEQAERLVGHLQDPESFGTELPIPSISRADATFGSDMWRGPVWINYNYLIARGLQEYGYWKLADRIIEKTINAISFWYCHDGVVYEYYDSRDRVSPARLNRKGPCIEPYDYRLRYQTIRDYGWSAALFVAMVFGRHTDHGFTTPVADHNWEK